MTRPAVLLAAIVAAFAAAAPAAASPSPHVQADVEAAHRYWQTGTAVPEPADRVGPCRGRWNVRGDATVRERSALGEATGLAFTYNPHGGVYLDERGHRWDWHVARCEFTLDPTIERGERRCIVAHEIGHFIHGPAHAGVMSVALWHGCIAVAYALEAQQHQQQQLDRARRSEERRRRPHPRGHSLTR